MAIKHRKFILGVFAAIMALGVHSVFINPVSADESKEYPIHLQISPFKQKIKLNPGESYVSSIKVMNIGTEKFTYKVSAAPYSVVDENYNADYDSSSSDYTKMWHWITFNEKDTTGTLEPHSEVDVPFTITVPKDVPSGGQYAAIMAETADGSDPGSVIQTVNRLGMILYADVAGDSRASGEIIENSINTFMFEPPITASSLVENTGNVETTATYIVKVWPLGSNETVFNNEDSSSRFVDIIPDTRRFNTVSWGGSPKLGIFTVEQTIEYLGKTSTVRKLVFICPLWLLFIIIVVIFSLVFWLVSRIIKRRKAKTSRANNNEQESRSI